MVESKARTVQNRTVLIVEDDAGVANLERIRLERASYKVLVAANATEALQKLLDKSIALILLDYRLPGGMDGLTFYSQVKEAGYDVPVILVTGFGTEATLIRALRVGVRDFVTKSPEYLDYLPEAVERVLRQVETEHQLAESEAQLASVIASAKDAILVVEGQRITLFNAAAEKMFRCPAEQALGQPLSRFIPPEYEPAAGKDKSAGHAPESVTLRVRSGKRGIRADGEEFPLEASLARGQVGGRKFHTIVVRDISQWVRAEQALRASEELYRNLVETTPDAIVVVDLNLRIVMVNKQAVASAGFDNAEEMVGKNCLELLAPEDRTRAHGIMDKVRQVGSINQAELTVQRKDGVPVLAEVNMAVIRDADGQPSGFLAVLRNITERKKLEAQLRQAQRMESIGALAGGVAHDFNNLLTVITGFSEILLGQLNANDPSRELVSEIRQAGDRAAALTRQLLAFSRKQLLAPKIIDLNLLVRETEKMLRRLIGEDIELETRLAAELGCVRADPGQLEQALLNLVVNARDAMPTGGHLTIATSNVELQSPFSRQHPEAPSGPFVMLVVSDTGCGMAEAVRAQIFEPFFTTKEIGKGTGLGLATVYGIVKQSGGHIQVHSEVGRGTVFQIYLPRVPDAERPRQSLGGPTTLDQGSETILLVEDEASVRVTARHVLSASGYTVLEAADGEAALQICQQHTEAIHLLLTDVVMPRMGGCQLADLLQPLRPDMKVLFLSGYTDDALVRHGVQESHMAFLQKPFTPAALARKVREVLDQQRSP
jgi:PAS domain S-box-containing protein